MPLLHAAGYEPEDVVAGAMDRGGEYPDYTLLPDDEEHKLYLEAKASGVSLDEDHAIQALNYANQNGKQWVILTNGREWRLYDNHIQGKADAKLVVRAELQSTAEAERFLRAIGKKSVCSGGLPKFAMEEVARSRQLAEEQRCREAEAARRDVMLSILDKELPQPDSALMRVLLEHLKSRPGLAATTAEEICGCLRGSGVSDKAPCTPSIPPPAGVSDEVFVVAASSAWGEYQRFSAYICQEKPTYKPTSHMAFYFEGAIETLVPRILDRVESVVLSRSGILKDDSLSAAHKDKLLRLVADLESARDDHHLGGRGKVLFLSHPNSPETIRLPHRIVNDKRTRTGKPWAFVVGKGYAPMARLLACPATTSALVQEE